ncbi:MAG: gamma-glutamylcyclotransferase, partial [Acetobacteraceae bacterium]
MVAGVGWSIDAGVHRRDSRGMTSSREPGVNGRVIITREGLRDGSLLARVRANLEPGMIVRSDAEIEASLDAMLAGCDPGSDVWLFAYGSLMWNPAFRYAERQPGLLRGWHRRFCLWLRSGRGSPQQPGLMLALDRGGACYGLAYRLAAPAREELLLVWRREMFGQAYAARWVRVALGDGVVPAITFVVNRRFERYAGVLADEVVAERLATAGGALGTCGEYLDCTLGQLRTFGLRDRGLERLEAMVGRAVG